VAMKAEVIDWLIYGGKGVVQDFLFITRTPMRDCLDEHAFYKAVIENAPPGHPYAKEAIDHPDEVKKILRDILDGKYDTVEVNPN
jgi:hypothetical protein